MVYQYIIIKLIDELSWLEFKNKDTDIKVVRGCKDCIIMN